MRFTARSILVLALLLVAAARAVGQTSQQELLAFVRDAQRASLDLIHTCSCRVDLDFTVLRSKPPTPQPGSCRYWWSPDAIRIQTNDGDAKVEWVWAKSVRTFVNRTPDGKVSAGRDQNGRYINRCDPWAKGLLALNVPGTIESIQFDELVRKSSRVLAVDRQTVGGRNFVCVKLYFDKSEDRPSPWHAEFYFDPSVNYLVRKVVYHQRADQFRREDEVVQFKDCGDGIYFPERIIGHSESEGKPSTKYICDIKDIQINRPLPENVFRLRLPHNTLFADLLHGVYYQVDAAGNKISKDTAIMKYAPPSAPAYEASYYGETQEEPRSLTRWILPLSVGALCLGAVLAALRKWRTGSTRQATGDG